MLPKPIKMLLLLFVLCIFDAIRLLLQLLDSQTASHYNGNILKYSGFCFVHDFSVKTVIDTQFKPFIFTHPLVLPIFLILFFTIKLIKKKKRIQIKKKISPSSGATTPSFYPPIPAIHSLSSSNKRQSTHYEEASFNKPCIEVAKLDR